MSSSASQNNSWKWFRNNSISCCFLWRGRTNKNNIKIHRFVQNAPQLKCLFQVKFTVVVYTFGINPCNWSSTPAAAVKMCLFEKSIFMLIPNKIILIKSNNFSTEMFPKGDQPFLKLKHQCVISLCVYYFLNQTELMFISFKKNWKLLTLWIMY